MASSRMFQVIMIVAIFATSCIAQLAPVATPTVSPVASPVAPPMASPAPTPVNAPAPAPVAPTPSPMSSGPSPSPSALAPSALSPGPSSGPSPAPGGPAADLPNGSFADGWVHRAVIAGTAIVGSFIAVTMM